MVEKQNINARVLVTVGMVSIILLVVIFLGVEAWFRSEFHNELQAKMAGDVHWDLASLRLDQQERINRYGWADPQAQTVTIPIDRAIELTAERQSQRVEQ